MHRQYLWNAPTISRLERVPKWWEGISRLSVHTTRDRVPTQLLMIFLRENPRLAKKHHYMPLIGLISNSRNNVEFYEQLADWRLLSIECSSFHIVAPRYFDPLDQSFTMSRLDKMAKWQPRNLLWEILSWCSPVAGIQAKCNMSIFANGRLKSTF